MVYTASMSELTEKMLQQDRRINVANENVEGETKNPAPENVEKSEAVPEGTLGRILEAVRNSDPGSITLVSGVEGSEYDEIRASLEKEGVHLMTEEGAIGHVRQAVNDRPDQQIVVLRSNLLEEAFRDSTSLIDAVDLAKLSERSGDNAKSELTEWLKRKQESNPDATATTAFQELLQNIRNASGAREVNLALKPDTALAVAFAAFARGGEITAESVDNTQVDLSGPVMIKIASGTITVTSGGSTIGSRSLN